MAVDLDKVERQLAEMLAAMAPHAEGDKTANVVIRIQMACIPAIVRWKAAEMNRGTDTNAVLNAFVALASSQMASIISEIADNGEEAFQIANSMLRGIGEEVGSILAGTSDTTELLVPAEASH